MSERFGYEMATEKQVGRAVGRILTALPRFRLRRAVGSILLETKREAYDRGYAAGVEDGRKQIEPIKGGPK